MLNVLPPVVRVKTKSQYLVALVCHAYRTKKFGEGSIRMAFNHKGFQSYLCCGRVTRLRMMTGRGAGKLGGSGPFLHIHRRQGELFGRKRNVNIFEEGSASYAANTIGGFEEVVSGLSAMFTTEGIGKNERLGKLTRTHEKASAIKIPITFCMHIFTALAVIG
jgi:hypothetical protein